METVSIIATTVSSVATVVIAVYAVVTHRLTKAIHDAAGRSQEQFSDLLQAIVVSNMTAGSGGAVSIAIKNFNNHYKGKTEIFKNA